MFKKISLILLFAFALFCLSSNSSEAALKEKPFIEQKGKELIISNAYFQYRLSLKDGLYLKEIINKYIQDDYLKEGKQVKLFHIMADDTPFDSSNFRLAKVDIKNVTGKSHAKIILSSINPCPSLKAEIEVTITDSPNSLWQLTLVNQSSKSFRLNLCFPFLAGIKIGENLENNWYIYNTHGARITNKPGYLRVGFGGVGIPIQILDIYDPVLGGGLYLRPDSHPGMDKIFAAYKSVNGSVGERCTSYGSGVEHGKLNSLLDDEIIDNSLGMGLAYIEQDFSPGESFLTPRVAIGVHKGDFHQALDDYKSWVKTWFKKKKPELPDWMKYDFVRVSGSPLRAFPGIPGYDLAQFIRPYEALFGENGSFCLCTWWNMETDVDAFGRKKEPGKQYGWNPIHGNFFEFNEEAGGEKRLRRGVKDLQEAGIKVSFYVTGLNLAKHCDFGERYGKEWRAIDFRGDDYSFWCSESEQNWSCCPAYEPYQEWLASASVNLVKKFDIDWLLVDVFGCFRPLPCYNPLHKHETPGIWVQGIEGTVRKIREEVEKIKPGPFPIICEGYFDYALQFIDGGEDMGWFYDIQKEVPISIPVQLFRFCFPEALIYCCPYGLFSAKELTYDHNYMLFNGLSLAFEPWGGLIPLDLDYMTRIVPIMRENGDAFRGDNPYPLLKTEAEGLYANSFPNNKGNKRVITLYNTNSSPLKGDLINLPYREGFHYVDLLNHDKISYRKKGNQVSLSLEMKTKDVIPVGELPQLLKVNREGANLEVSIPGAKDSSLRLLLLDEYNELFKKESFSLSTSPFTLDLKDTFGTECGKLIVQFFKGRFLVDEAIVEGEPIPSPKRPDLMAYYQLDEDKGKEVADRCSGKGNNGLLKGGRKGAADSGSSGTQLVESGTFIYNNQNAGAFNGWVLGSGSERRTITDSKRTGSWGNYAWRFTWGEQFSGFGGGSSYEFFNPGVGSGKKGPCWTTGVSGSSLKFDGLGDYI